MCGGVSITSLLCSERCKQSSSSYFLQRKILIHLTVAFALDRNPSRVCNHDALRHLTLHNDKFCAATKAAGKEASYSERQYSNYFWKWYFDVCNCLLVCSPTGQLDEYIKNLERVLDAIEFFNQNNQNCLELANLVRLEMQVLHLWHSAFCILMNILQISLQLTTYQPQSDHISITYRLHTNCLYQPNTNHTPTAFTDHIPTTYLPHTNCISTAFADHILTTYQPHTNCFTDHIPTTYPPHTNCISTAFTDHILTTYQPHTNCFTDHIPTTYPPHTNCISTAFTDHILTAYQPHTNCFTDHIPTTYKLHINRLYWPHTDHIPTTHQLFYWPHTNHIPTTYKLHTDCLCWPHTNHILTAYRLPLPTTYQPDQLVHYCHPYFHSQRGHSKNMDVTLWRKSSVTCWTDTVNQFLTQQSWKLWGLKKVDLENVNSFIH